jgi:hypothetical protein
VRGLDVLGALRRLGAVRQQRDARLLQPHHGLHESRAHVRELDEVLGPDLDVGAAVEQQERLARHRHEHRQRRPVDAAGALHVEQPGRERRARRAARHERLRAPVGDRVHRLDDRGLGRRPHRARGIRGLGDRDRSVDYLDAGRGLDLARGPEQEHADRAVGSRQRRAARDLGGTGIGPVGVERDRQRLSGHCRTTA